MGQAGETFVLQLATAATPEELAAWMADAAPRARAIYAQGADLPREAAGVKLVQGWIDSGLVVPLTQRDPRDARRFQFMVERTAERADRPGTTAFAEDRTIAAQKAAVLAALTAAARVPAPCPSNADLARVLGLGRSERGRQRARYLVDRLREDGAIAVEYAGRFAGRVVTITSGSARGCKTAGPATTGPRTTGEK